MIALPNASQLLDVYGRAQTAPVAHVRDIGLIQSALDRANTTVYGQEVYSGIHAKTAAVIDSLAHSHPLLDGNKRLMLVTAHVIYSLNGLPFLGKQAAAADLMVEVASAHLDADDIAARLSTLWGGQ